MIVMVGYFLRQARSKGILPHTEGSVDRLLLETGVYAHRALVALERLQIVSNMAGDPEKAQDLKERAEMELEGAMHAATMTDSDLKYMAGKLSRVHTLAQYEEYAADPGKVGTIVHTYVSSRDKTREFERNKEAVKKAAERNPRIKGKAYSVDQQLAAVEGLEQSVFGRNPILTAMLPPEYRAKFTKSDFDVSE